ncbi:hypothetical protein ACE5JW_05045 [Acinetobacter radioresistens]|jgi:hypothetical protein|uniref:Uncharacterized protein n=3 Tax=Acinetobacter radioresistens TaxID=40216 RepID=A0A8H2PWH5_ACIRA|nr:MULTISPECIES: hypothetical protein [Acinetobacter]AWV85701.1 hypothetical protein DOM24_03640 [Acinetobacter radioresistens]EET83339.1 hypothetical protein ACIRA0001_1047 [Acinetobacter radioresistens SK82]EEY88050.1 hypothetical protein HMPREF0018_00797 [Acinetobacter radioresistens SH164]EJO35859.1 hypothetical protein ACINWCA157_1242 [Acinetobacter radioresistens WC-A-157]ENV86890.1 hypothetical protein F940_00850 [Acinetobacter radioresistens NIPH 2130]
MTNSSQKAKKAAQPLAKEQKNEVIETTPVVNTASEALTQQEPARESNQALWARLESLKSQLTFSGQEISELKNLVKSEFTHLVDELAKLSQDLKADISQISLKHKENLTETFKRSKANAVEVWNKVQRHN